MLPTQYRERVWGECFYKQATINFWVWSGLDYSVALLGFAFPVYIMEVPCELVSKFFPVLMSWMGHLCLWVTLGLVSKQASSNMRHVSFVYFRNTFTFHNSFIILLWLISGLVWDLNSFYYVGSIRCWDLTVRGSGPKVVIIQISKTLKEMFHYIGPIFHL